MCHGYKLDSLNCCCQLLPCSNGEKSGSFMKIVEVLQLQLEKHAKRVCEDSWTFTRLSKTVHYHIELAKWLHF